ncbi:MAG TPA: phosphoribosyltransferase family protein [Streptosporangiaceae bacterium]|nr:phosphoribosyltransferase family protein [Streptosporangiaceae bacterium]
MTFADREDAGGRLADLLEFLRGQPVVVLGLPRGGVPVAAKVASKLGAPMDVIIVRKTGVPFQPELAMGAVGEDGIAVTSPDVVAMAGVTDQELAAAQAREGSEVAARAARYRAGRPRLDLTGKVAVVVDDGIATGATARAACQIARAHGAARVVLAVPVAPAGWQERVGVSADEFVSVLEPLNFFAVGQFYDDFSQTTDEQVTDCLRAAGTPSGPAGADPADDPPPDDPPGIGAAQPASRPVEPIAGTTPLAGNLTEPAGLAGTVIFAHGSGSSRHSPRNRYVAAVLAEAGLGTLLFDLLTPAEEADRANVFDIGLLAGRLSQVTAWLRTQQHREPIGYFGASTGAAAALWAAAEPGADIAAVVSRGGRPDLAAERLAAVTAPTLLIVGGHDAAVLDLNRTALAELRCDKQLAVVPGATHLFDEPGTLEAAAALARDWFLGNLGRAAGSA